jgi:hypothetical protein
MSYIGNTPISVAFLTDTFSGNGSTTAFTMTVAPANTSSILVAVTGVVQDPSTYSVAGTTLTFSGAPPSGTSNISVRYLGIPASGVTTTAYRTVTDTTATASQTSFTIPSYTVGYVDVFRNGVRLAAADFTATTGTTVVLANACTVGDTVTTVSFYVSSVLNALPQTGGTLTGQLVVNGATGQNPLITQVNSTEVMRIDASGNMGIGTSSPNSRMSVAVSSTSTSVLGTYANIPLLLQNTSSTDNNWTVIGVQDASGDFSSYIGTQNTSQASNTAIMAFATNGGSGATERMRIDSNGNLLVGTTSDPGGSARVGIKGSGTTISTVSLYIINSSSVGNFLVYDNGAINTGTTSAGSPYVNTTATAANAVLSADGFLRRSTSSLKYKTDIQDATHGLTDLLKLRSVTYKGKNDGDIIFGGLIAEEVDAAGLNEFVQYAADGSPDALAYGNMVSLCVKAIQEQQALITQLQADVAALKGKA